ncbi:putative autotransporter adhesin-like protein [Mucilaginibacter oryzae]|uniref:Putative autotransporter adhesin-like protein n=2 Tax=Mucilaginibacter oryzae TaxID=468058 RepID=A0A316HDG2_9SPHI|nr:putative autotransporter adhesin-like protein [Mucilaginibacter oryzae]
MVAFFNFEVTLNCPRASYTTTMKKHFLTITIISAFIVTGILSSCRLKCVHGSGNQTTEKRKADDFKKVEISGAFKVHLKQDSTLGITITADDNLIKYISTSVEGGTLHIKSKKNFCDPGDMVINIGVKNLEEVKAAGAVEVFSDGKITAKDFKLDLSGATKVTLDLNAANVSTEGSGATEITLKGQAASHKIDLSGAGKVNAFDFVVGTYDIETSGIGHCNINVLQTLNVHTSGASEIQYKGSPSTVNNDKSGASSIKKVD